MHSTDGLSPSGGTGETRLHDRAVSRRAVQPLEPVLLECNYGWGVAGGILSVT